MQTKNIDLAYEKAVEALKSCSKPAGLYASGLPGGYEATWARDSMITTLGACLVGDTFKKAIKSSLELLSKNQSENGQIPNCVGSFNEDRQSDVTFNSIDSSLWYIIGHFAYANAYGDLSLIEKYKNNIAKAMVWLKYQDPNEDKLLVQQPTMDWMDAFPHKYGRVLNTQALYYIVLSKVGNTKLAEYIKSIINGETQKYLSLYDNKLGYYLPWAWKNHDTEREQEEWFDSLGNLLAIIGGLATPKIAASILKYIDKSKVNRPYPCKALWPPIKPGDKEWKSYFALCDAREPYQYLNSGIWPFIGGFYIAALVKVKDNKKAQSELEIHAKGVLQELKTRDIKDSYPMNEWLDGITGEAKGEPFQAWTAGAYIYAYECVRRKKAVFFD